MASPLIVYDESAQLKKKIIIYLIGFFIGLYISILFGACWSPNVSFLRWLGDFSYYVFEQHHFFIFAFTEATPKVIAIVEGAWFLGSLMMFIKIDHPYAGKEYGDSRWGNPVSFTKKFGNHDQKHLVTVDFGDVPAPAKPVVVNTHNYWLAEGVYLNLDNKHTSNLNIEVIGPPGTGKSFRLVRPILSQLSGSFVVTDPKGELSQQCGQFFEDNGYGVHVFDFESEQSMSNSHHFNPFMYIETESDILSLCEILFKATSDPNASTDQFFENMAKNLLTSIFYLMHYTYPKSMQDWRHFVELLDCDTVKVNPQTGAIDISDPNCLMQRFIRANDKWKQEHNGETLKGFIDVEKIYTNAQETASSIISSLDAHCNHLRLDCVVDLLSSDDLDIVNTFGYAKGSPTGKHILFMVTSENDRHFDWMPSMVYSLLISKLYFLTKNDPSLHQCLPEHLTLLMDEFNNIVLPDDFVDLTSTMRSRGISVVVIIQNLLQLKHKFPKDDMDKNLRANMSTTLVLGGPDKEVSCETLSKEFGPETIHKQTTGVTKGMSGSSSENEDVMEHMLLPADKIYKMSKDGPCAINVRGADPLWVSKVQFQNSPLCPLLTRKNPYRIKKRLLSESVPYDFTKSPYDQMPKMYCGKEADELLKQAEAEGVKVITLTEDDLMAISLLEEANMPIPGKDPSTKEFWNNIYKETATLLDEEKKAALTFDLLSNEQLIVTQMLKNAGFSIKQINALSGLINLNYGIEELLKLFNKDMPVTDIQNFTDRLLKVKSSSI